MKSIAETLPLAASFLGDRKTAEEIFAFVLGVKRIDLYLQYDRLLIEAELEQMRALVKRCAKGEPLSYLFRQVEFYGCRLEITRDVLIPRPETELLVNLVAARLKSSSLEGKSLWDLCSGSGCIGLALKKTFPHLEVTLSDVSSLACAVAQKNANQNQLEVEILCGDLLAPLKGRKTHFLIANPPYVSKKEYQSLEESVRCYEPSLALLGGEDGFLFYERLARELPCYLEKGAYLFFEIGCTQGERVLEIFQGSPWRKPEIIKDFAGHDRFFFLETE